MSNSIHPTAILEGNINLGSGNVIGPNVVMRGDITLGNNNKIGVGTCLVNNVVIGNDNHIHALTSIGAIGEMGSKGDRLVEDGKVIIGDHVTIREFVTVSAPVHSKVTGIGDKVYLMNKSYVAHDVMIGQGSVLSAGVLLGGQVVLEEYVSMGLGATVHQRCHVGAFAMVGMQAPVNRDVLPYSTVAGNPMRIIGFNRIGAERHGVDAIWLDEMELVFAKEIKPVTKVKNPLLQRVMDFLAAHPESLIQIKS